MKFAKLSIAAIAVLGMASSAMAAGASCDDKITYNPFGSAKLYYETVDVDGSNSDLFDQGNATGGALLSGGLTGKINSCFGYGFEAMAVDTLGLENNLVSGVRMGNGNGAPEDTLDTQFWFPQAYLTYHPCDMGTNTTFKIGRQYLDTPLAFTERWNLAPNSFDAIVAMNQDILNTTLVAAYVGRGNGVFGKVTNGADFDEYGKEGAYALGVITNLFDGTLPIQLWGYDVVNAATAYWADAGYKLDLGDGLKFDLGAQYGMISPDDDANSLATALGAVNPDDTSGFGVKVGTDISVADMVFGLSAAYTSVDSDGVIGLSNTATLTTNVGGTGYVGGKKTKLYTAGIYTDGTHVALPGSDAFKVKASTKLAGIGGLAVAYIHNENDNNNKLDVDEIDVVLSSGILPGGLNTKLIYINRDYDQDTVSDSSHIRMILSKKF